MKRISLISIIAFLVSAISLTLMFTWILETLSITHRPDEKYTAAMIFLFILFAGLGIKLVNSVIMTIIHNVVNAKNKDLNECIRLKNIVNHVDDGIITINADGIIVDINDEISTIFGYTTAECIGRNISLIIAEDAQSAKIQLLSIVGKNNIKLTGIKQNKDSFPIEISISKMEHLHSYLLVATIRDITNKITYEKKLQENEGKFELAFDASSIGMTLLSMDGHFEKTNPALCELLGYSQNELANMNLKDIAYLEDMKSDSTFFNEITENEKKHIEIDTRLKSKDGHIIWARVNLNIMTDSLNQALFIICQIQDITEQKQNEAHLNYQARHDTLTGLANRAELDNRLNQLIEHSQKNQKKFALFFLDLDKFKQINDTYGHDAGDKLLKIVAERLEGHARKSDVIARIGGDEFIFAVQDLQNYENAAAFAERILNALIKPMAIKGHQLFISSSIGISFYPMDGADAATLIRNADNALYKSKEKGRNNYQFCQSSVSLEIIEKIAFESALEKALVNDEFQLYYLPQVSSNNKTILGVEALIRWQSKNYGIVTPDHIIPIAEETGIIIPLSEWIIETACTQVRHWQEQEIPKLRLSTNISVRQFLHKNVIESIEASLTQTHFDSTNFTIEINENLIMQDAKLTMSIISKLKSKGIKITIDNFGTGYSSLSFLQEFGVDYIKIDRSLIKSIISNPSNAKLVVAIITLAKNLGVQVIAEGVETKEQYEFLLHHGCDEIQGFYICKPMLAEQFTDFIKKRINSEDPIKV